MVLKLDNKFKETFDFDVVDIADIDYIEDKIDLVIVTHLEGHKYGDMYHIRQLKRYKESDTDIRHFISTQDFGDEITRLLELEPEDLSIYITY